MKGKIAALRASPDRYPQDLQEDCKEVSEWGKNGRMSGYAIVAIDRLNHEVITRWIGDPIVLLGALDILRQNLLADTVERREDTGE